MEKYYNTPSFYDKYRIFREEKVTRPDFTNVQHHSTPSTQNVEEAVKIGEENDADKESISISDLFPVNKMSRCMNRVKESLTKRRLAIQNVFTVFVLFGLLLLTIQWLYLYTSPLDESSRYKTKPTKIFYLLDVCGFEDSDRDKAGDFIGIAKNLKRLRNLGVTNLILTNPCVGSTTSEESFLNNLNTLIKLATSYEIKVLWDITGHLQNKTLKIFPEHVDGYFFSAYRFELNTKTGVDLALVQLIDKRVAEVNSTWFVELADHSRTLNQATLVLPAMYRLPSLVGVVLSIRLGINFSVKVSMDDKQFLYNFLMQQIHRQKLSAGRVFVYHINSQEKDERGVFVYTYLYAAIAFSGVPIMLRAGQEFGSGEHTTMNYGERFMRAERREDESYINYLSALKTALSNKRFQMSLRSASSGHMGSDHLWTRRKVAFQNKTVYALALLTPYPSVDAIHILRRGQVFFNYSNPLGKPEGELSALAVYYLHMSCKQGVDC